MLFFFGLGQTYIKTVPLPNLTCAHCSSPGTVATSVFSRYLHLFWIPVIPLGKFSVTQCQHCKQALEKKEMPAAYQMPVATVQNSARLPLTNYLVLILLGIGVLFIIGVGLFSDKTTTAKATPAAAEDSSALPPVGAVYSMELGQGTGSYSLMQVTKATPDSLYFRITNPLHSQPDKASIAGTMRDSVAPANQATPFSKQQWQTTVKYNKLLERLQ